MEEDKYPNNLAEIQVDAFFRAREIGCFRILNLL